MITYNYETEFELQSEEKITTWINKCITKGDSTIGELNYIFCDDKYLHKINVEYLNHDTLTDIISFDYTCGTIISGDIFISIERVKENATKFSSSFDDELHRVIIHGILHYMKYKDKTDDEKIVMRAKEDECLSLLK